ncbi:hypothetical protein GBAR_LOCUS14117 [Geodia barretti]|uniref:Fibronectin type-III domain-containing protein n=1 Tax=Geodia barretti TaxID=519541 RepID=A0AA35S6D6_GEOBA|nr:hypothetical protein GBAR_LOCUS14117 [Geodia barretti]
MQNVDFSLPVFYRSPGSCDFNGEFYENGTSFPAPDGCNTCFCFNGQISCTEIFCVPALESECQFSAVPGRQTFGCLFTNQLESVTCSFDGGPGEACTFPLEVGIGRFGTDSHTLVVTVVDVFGRSEVVSFNFSLIAPQTPRPPPVFEGVCGTSGVAGRQRFDCTFTNDVVSVTCSFDGGEAENCTLPLIVDIGRFGTDNHTVVLTATDEFGQTSSISLGFRLTAPDLRVVCGTDAVPGRQRFFCDASNPIASIMCSFDGGVAEICSFPVVAEFDRFGTDSHTLVVTLVDVFGQSTSVSLDFTLVEPAPPVTPSPSPTPPPALLFTTLGGCLYEGIVYENGASFPAADGCNTCTCSDGMVGCTEIACPELEVVCSISAVPGRQEFACGVTAPIASITCSFDGGPGEACTFPLEVGIGRFGTDSHTLVVTVVDVFGRSEVVSFNFSLIAPQTPRPPPALESECQFSAVPGRQTFGCLFTNQLESVTCSFDGGPGEACAFPLEVGIGRFGTDNHTLVVTVVDEFGQTLELVFEFSLIEVLPPITELEGECGAFGVTGRQRFDCTFSNNLTSITCSFDGGEAEGCFFPVIVDFERFGTENHTLVVTVVDEFGQFLDIVFEFQLTEPPTLPPVPSEFEISFDADVATAEEDSSSETLLIISRQGSSFGPIPVIVRAFTFGQYESFRGSFNSPIGQEAPDLPDDLPDPAAANDDFNSSAQSFVLPDEISLTFVPVAVEELDPRDRNSITVTNSLVLINIEDDDRPLTCDVTGQIVDSVAVFGCAGPVPPDVMNIECLLDDTISFDCANVVSESVVVPQAAVGRHVVKVVGRAGGAEPLIPLGQITFNVPPPAIDITCDSLLDGLTFLYVCEANNNISSVSCFINDDTPTDCELSDQLRISDLPPGEHTLTVIITDIFGQRGQEVFTFTRIPLFEVECSVVDSVIECTSMTLIAAQSCSIGGGSFFDCLQPLDIAVLAARANVGVGQHTLTIISRDLAGQQTTDTVDFNVTIVATVPSAPINVIAVALSPTAIEISWSPPDSDGGSEITNYFLGIRDLSSQLELGAVAGPDARTFIHTGLSPATTYNLSVTAANVIGSGPTVSLEVTTPPGGPEGCVEVEVDLELCVARVGGREVDGSVTISQVRVSRVMINLWRVAVPNCQRPGLVMWVTCMSNRLRFDVNRGSSLRPSSHGLLGQFWNIPISVGDLDSDSSPDIQLYQPGHPSYRHFPALFYPLVWDLSDDGCYYVGNSQGGPREVT